MARSLARAGVRGPHDASENEHELHERDERRETEAKLPRFDMCGVRGIKNELCQRKRPHVRKEEGKRAVQGMRLRVP